MARRIYEFEEPDRFIAGALGQPGDRTFYLQVREGSRLISVLIEKVQVALLAERLSMLLAEVRERGADVPQDVGTADLDTKGLDEPINELFRVGTMAIVWDGDDESVIVEARAISEDDLEGPDEVEVDEDEDEEVDEETDLVRVHLSPRRALAFARSALDVVASGRPPCPFCGQPLNPEGHICTRRNGFMH
jgi:uncharacterized repeat protein (TIGR03847 family)